MDHRSHAHIPAGTLADLNSRGPVTVTRDYTHAHFPAMELDAPGVRALMLDVLPKLYADMKAAVAEEIAEAEELAAADLPDRCAYHGGEGDGGVFCDECREDQAAAAGRRAGR
jgi:hypothetical protein